MNTPSRPIILRASNLHKTFYYPSPLPILCGISLEVQQGETLAIMGTSGEGKSTLLHILGTLEKASSGDLEISGKNVLEPVFTVRLRRFLGLFWPLFDSNFGDNIRRLILPPKFEVENRLKRTQKSTEAHCEDRFLDWNPNLIRNQHIGFVFQSFFLLEEDTALENVLIPASIGRKVVRKGSVAYDRGEKLLSDVGLFERAHFPAKLLSGGEKQRLAIARALCNDPDLLLADEPTGNLDHKTSMMIHELLFRFVKDHQKTLIVVTHDQELADLCDKIYLLREGCLHQIK